MEPDRVVDLWGPRRPYDQGHQWPERTDQYLTVAESEVDRWVPSACLLCSNGCGLDIAVKNGEMVGVRGRPTDRVNHGRLGPKGLYGWQGQQRDRLKRPLVRDSSGVLAESSWETAMHRIVSQSRRLLDERGGLSHAFYTSGQLMLEEYYTLAVIGKAGVGTPHMDGNTRLCTATAAAALKETFGTDGQPGTYADIDACDVLFLFGHNVAETQTVLWSRVLDRLESADPLDLVCVDPRQTAVAKRATIHLEIKPGTNLAVVNGLLHLLIREGWTDQAYIDRNTLGFDRLDAVVREYTPTYVAEACGVRARDVEAAAELFGTSERVVSTVLQGFYQSHQATAASCGVNNLHLLRGLLGRPGCGVLQMNGQPTAQNNRECGANGDLPGFRNWDNPDHVAELAELWDIDPIVIPSWAPPTHAMQLFRYVEQGSISFLWIAGTNPALSLPDLHRIRDILTADDCFIVVSDGYLTETAAYADVVLPVALWGERTGTYTNSDRTVHLSEQAVAPPGESRSDLEIWLEYSRLMDFRTRSGRPLPWWSTPEEAFAAWKRASEGRPCDYTGLDYDKLRDCDGVQWPCTAERPDGTARLYTDHKFNTDSDYCENYGHELVTGAVTSATEHRALRPDGRAFLKAAHYSPAPESPGQDFPYFLNTGRTGVHFHTRTKTGRVGRLESAAPEAWVELSAFDAEQLGVANDELVRVSTPRGAVEVRARISDIREGTVFLPFHYGYDARASQAANELTLTAWDPVSKQPSFKNGSARIERIGTEEETR